MTQSPFAIKPWRRLPVIPCMSCGVQATRWVEHIVDGYEDVVIRGRHVGISLRHTWQSTWAGCEEHAEEITWRWADEFGGASSNPIQHTWRTWLWCSWVGRFISHVQEWVDRHRDPRDTDRLYL